MARSAVADTAEVHAESYVWMQHAACHRRKLVHWDSRPLLVSGRAGLVSGVEKNNSGVAQATCQSTLAGDVQLQSTEYKVKCRLISWASFPSPSPADLKMVSSVVPDRETRTHHGPQPSAVQGIQSM